MFFGFRQTHPIPLLRLVQVRKSPQILSSDRDDQFSVAEIIKRLIRIVA